MDLKALADVRTLIGSYPAMPSVAATRVWMSKCPVAANPQTVPAKHAASNQTNAVNRGRPLGWASMHSFGMVDPVGMGAPLI